MGLVEEVGTFLQTAGVGTLGTSLFLNTVPDEPDTCVAVLESPVSREPRRTFGASLPVEMPRFQVYARAASHATARTKIQDVWNALEVVIDQTLSGTRYERIAATTSPSLLKRDEKDRWVFVANFEASRVL